MPLPFIPLSSAWFYVLYLFCGLTDMIDGTIARKTGAVSKFGEKLDTAADFVFMAVCVKTPREKTISTSVNRE